MVNFKRSLLDISEYAGNRFDLAQAGGGNSSVKISKTEMLVKASGINLSEVSASTGYVSVDYSYIRQFLATFNDTGLDKKQREERAKLVMQSSKLEDTGQPSIETFLHALLNTFTLHTHPISINALACTINWKEDLLSIWPEAVCVPYHTPGIDLALTLATEINAYSLQYGCHPKVVFLQNHGLIITSDNAQEVIELTETVNHTVANAIGFDTAPYENITTLQALLKRYSKNSISIILNDDSTIKTLIEIEDSNTAAWPFCPDTFIYCGVKPVYLNDISDNQAINNYFEEFNEYPKVIILNGNIYFCANNLRKAKEAQELFKFHLMSIQFSSKNIQRLSLREISYLSNWDAEKFRQGV